MFLQILCRYAENGDLLTILNGKSPVEEERAAIWFAQLSSAVKYLHSQYISHRDLKCM